jgi:branched-chain amino acid transport system permease protein
MTVWEIYLTTAMHGLVYGMLIFLVASGLTLVLGMAGVLNIAHAALYMLGAYFAYTFTLSTGSFWLSLLLSPLIVALIAVVIERFLLRKTYAKGHVPQILLTFGLLYMISEIVRMVWGTNPLRVFEPPLLSGEIPFLGGTYPVYRIFIIGFSLLILIGMLIFLMRTRVGLIIRAAVHDADMVGALGTNVPIYLFAVYAGGAILAAVAGVIAAPMLSIFSGMGDQILLDCFVVIIVGGFGSLLGAFVAALLVGELQSFGVLWIPQLALVFEFLLMAVVLAIRPTGLFGEEA